MNISRTAIANGGTTAVSSGSDPIRILECGGSTPLSTPQLDAPQPVLVAETIRLRVGRELARAPESARKRAAYKIPRLVFTARRRPATASCIISSGRTTAVSSVFNLPVRTLSSQLPHPLYSQLQPLSDSSDS